MRTWLARVFGGRAEEADEPARVEPTVSAKAVQPPVRRTSAVSSRARRADAETGVLTLEVEERRGFDPYNSGAFHRDSAWDRVISR